MFLLVIVLFIKMNNYWPYEDDGNLMNSEYDSAMN